MKSALSPSRVVCVWQCWQSWQCTPRLQPDNQDGQGCQDGQRKSEIGTTYLTYVMLWFTMFGMSKILDELKAAIGASDQSRYRIAQETGIAEAALSRLMSGERGLSVESVEILADYLGLEITIRPKRRRKGGKSYG